MRLGPLLAGLSDAELDRLALEHVRTDERPSRGQLCILLESAIRSYRFVHDFVINRQPPTFAILTLILESEEYQTSIINFKERALAETNKIAEQLSNGELISRKDQLRLYRKALYEARRNDLDLNASEAALLAVLRREERIAQVEHFLIEHHEDFKEFWDRDDSFVHELNALRAAGLIFVHEAKFIIPSDVAPAVWQTLGIDLTTDSARRLYEHLSNSELAEILDAAGMRSSGSKEVRLDRMLTERVQPRFALEHVGLSTLKDICRESEAAVAGTKDELIERIVVHFAQRKDQVAEDTVEVARVEDRALAEHRFVMLFAAMSHLELTDILRRFPDLRQTGTKERKISTLWDSHLAETTLLGELMNRQLEDLLSRIGLKIGGSKNSRIQRIVEHFGAMTVASTPDSSAAPSVLPSGAIAEDVSEDAFAAVQGEFIQRASNPPVSLQPWLDSLLGARGKIRCYATEDENPTKQLKNKLSQAAAARDGLLVLVLAGREQFEKAREALVERWMQNDEWSKSVAAVALAHPIGEARVEAIVQRSDSSLAGLLKSRVFPKAELLGAVSTESSASMTCTACGSKLDQVARFGVKSAWRRLVAF
jgi:hypothetical protein